MPTTVTKTIGSGGGRDYSDPATWEAAAPANLVTSDQVWRGECYNDSTFTGTFTIAGSTVDSTRYKELTAAAGQSFADTSSNALRFNSSNGVTIVGSGGYSTQVVCSENYFRMSRLQVGNSANNSNAFSSGNTGIDINQCAFQSGNSVGATAATVTISTSSKIRNSFIRTTNTSWPALELANDASAYNVTLISLNSNTVRGISFFYANGTVQNCAQFGFALASKTANSSGVTITTSYTDVVGPTGGWTGSIAFSTATFTNVTAGSENMKLVSGSALLDVGTTDSTNAATDIFGTSRPSGSAYDVGCYEYVASVASALTKSFTHQFARIRASNY